MKLKNWKACKESTLGVDSSNITSTLLHRTSHLLCCVLVGATTATYAEEEAVVTYEGNFPENAVVSYMEEAPPAEGDGYLITEVAVTGDRKAAYGLEEWDSIEGGLIGSTLTNEQVAGFASSLGKTLQEAGFVFATVTYRDTLLSEGLLVLKVQTGQQGSVVVKGNSNYTAKQVLEFIEWESGDEFNYNDLFKNLYKANSKSHLKINSSLKPRDIGDGRRVVDVEFTVEEKFPGNVSLRLSNDGTRQTTDYRARLNAQLTNPFKQDGKLAVSYMTDPGNADVLNAFNGSYSLPFKDLFDFSIYGAYVESNINDLFNSDIDIFGQGYFFGVGISDDIYTSDAFNLKASLGWTFIRTKTVSTLGGVDNPDRYVQQSMPRFTFTYIGKEYDFLNGKNFGSISIFGSAADFLGSSRKSENEIKGESDGTFFVTRFDYSRLQKIWDDPDSAGSWSLFFNFAGQLTNETLPSNLQFALGGANSVRGYQERIARGDYGFDTTLELRTPLITNFLPDLKKDEDFLHKNPDYWGQHRLQFITFVDAGKVVNRNPAAGSPETEDMLSVGVGLRLGFTKYSQLSFDYGFPLKPIEGVDNGGRAHVALDLIY